MTPILSYRPPETELKNLEQWAQANNVKLNRAKSLKVIFQNNRRQIHTDLPPTLPEIARTTAIKMLGVTVTNHLSVSEHVRDVISRCVQSIYALKLLRSHGMNDDELRTIYKSVVLVKLLYVVPGGASPRRMTRDNWKRSFDGASS